jgi:hypothetical protein
MHRLKSTEIQLKEVVENFSSHRRLLESGLRQLDKDIKELKDKK